jgi:alpha-galactosidase
LYNEGDASISLAVDFAALGWPAGTKAAVRDLWEHKDLGDFTGRYPASGNVTVAPHNTVMLRITPA